MTPLFGKGVGGWDALRDDILTFTKLVGFQPTHDQAHYLLRIQNGHDRLGLVKPFEYTFPIIATSMMWRALCWQTPSICFTEFPEHGESWVRLIAAWLQSSDPSVKGSVELSVAKRAVRVNKVRVCHVVGPFVKEDSLIPGKQDILLLDFDEMPRSRFDRALQLADGAIMYLPQPSHGPLVQHKHRQANGDGPQGDPSSRS